MNKEPRYYVKGVLNKDKRILARTITLIESSLSAHQELAWNILNSLLPHTGGAMRLGITGVPGAGKSTFIEALGIMLIEKGYKVAVLAIDPSSTKSGGSILADKTRMERLSTLDGAFIRPSPSGGTLGGVAKKTRETMLVLEAAGYDVIIVETVGVGQSETTVASMVDFFLVLMIAGAGDGLQGIKKGVLELADAIVINKADGDNLENAKRARKEYETAIHLLAPTSAIWAPPVMTCSALKMTGIDKIWDMILDHRKKMSESGELEARRKAQALEWMWFLIKEGLNECFFNNPKVKKLIPGIKKEVESGTKTPSVAANELLFILDNG